MAGFAHANVVVDILKLSSSDQIRFMTELEKVITIESNFVGLKDQAAEPLWTTHDLNGLSLSVEIFSQLEEVLSIYDLESRFLDLRKKVSLAVEEKKKNVNFSIRFGSPGPLEAHHSKMIERSSFELSDFDAVESLIQEDMLAEKPWSLLSMIGRTRRFSSEMITKVSELIGKLPLNEQESSKFFDCIALASYIGANQLSELLADSIREKIKRSVGTFVSAEDARTALFVLTIGSGGIPKEKRDSWLADAVAQIAFYCQKAQSANRLKKLHRHLITISL